MKNLTLIGLLTMISVALAVSPVVAKENEMIWFTLVPSWGDPSTNLTGKVNADPAQYRVAGVIFIEEAGGWWTKPSFSSPTVPINGDSTFVLDFTSGGLDAYCTRLLAVMVPANYQVPSFGGVQELPEEFLDHPYAIAARPHGDRKLDWQDVRWTAKRSINGMTMGPGPNVFSSDESQVYIDQDSYLHLNIKNNGTGQWLCSELIADTSFGYGTYTFDIHSRVDNLDLNAVLGIFTWDDIARYSMASPENFYREYDIELSKWTDPLNDVGQYVIQPWDYPGNIYRFPMGAEINTIHQWTWKKDTIAFRSMREDSTLIAGFEYTGSSYKEPGFENIRINLWLINGWAPQSDQEKVISGFHFENIITAPQNVIASDGNLHTVTVTWNEQAGRFFNVYRSVTDNPVESEQLNGQWFSENIFFDTLAEPNIVYYYWVRSSDNALGSNKSGYASGYSAYDTGWAADTISAIYDQSFAKRISISPNPCDGFTTIHLPGNFNALFKLYDEKGNLIQEKTVGHVIELNTTGLPDGIYYVHLFTKACHTFTEKLIVSH